MHLLQECCLLGVFNHVTLEFEVVGYYYSKHLWKLHSGSAVVFSTNGLWGIWHHQDGIPGTELDKKILFFFLGVQKQNGHFSKKQECLLTLKNFYFYVLTENKSETQQTNLVSKVLTH